VLQHQGKHEEAEKMEKRALKGGEKVLNTEHPDALTNVSNLVFVLPHRGEKEETEEVEKQALEGREQVIGAEHPNTLTSKGHLTNARIVPAAKAGP
jgi:hypothetical protein